MHVSASAGVLDSATENIWNNTRTCLLKTTEEVCDKTRPHCWRRDVKVPSDWEQSFIVFLYKGKGDARGKYSGLKLTKRS